MRCLNCGWDNPDHTSVCVKCGQPLIETAPQEETPNYQNEKPTIITNNKPEQEVCRKTVVIQTGGTHAPTQRLHKPQICEHCGYPVVTGDTICPNCGSPMNASKEGEKKPNVNEVVTPINEEVKCICDNCGEEINGLFSFCPKCGAPIRRQTIRRPIKQIAELKRDLGPTCSLTLMPEPHEGLEPETYAYHGEKIVLNRDNTEQKNFTITSKEQAELTFEDGNWYITDCSEQKTTYIQVTRKMQLQPGDVVILGDRKFQFQKEEE